MARLLGPNGWEGESHQIANEAARFARRIMRENPGVDLYDLLFVINQGVEGVVLGQIVRDRLSADIKE